MKAHHPATVRVSREPRSRSVDAVPGPQRASGPASGPGHRPVRAALAACVLAAWMIAGGPSVAGAAEKRSDNDRRCASGVRAYSRGEAGPIDLQIPVPGPIAPFLRTEYGEAGPASPWVTTRGGTLSGVAIARRTNETILSACEEVPDSRYVQAAGRPITIADGERLVAVTVAHPWIAWATARSRSHARPIVRWRRLSSADRTAKTIRPGRRVTALVPDVGGRLTISTVGGGTQRIDTYDRLGRITRVATVDGVSSEPRKALASGLQDVWLWEPRTLAIDGNIGDAYSEAIGLADFPRTAPSRIVDLPRTTSPCRLRSPGQVTRLRTTLASIDIIDAKPWTYSDTTHIRVCDTQHRLVARGTLAASVDAGSSFGGAALVGHALIVTGTELRGSSAGSESERTVRILERTPSGRLVITRQDDTDVRATSTTAAAWITTKTRRLWVSDALGVRLVDMPLAGGPNPFPSQRNEVRLTLTDRVLEVRTPQGATTAVPIAPLPTSAVANPQPIPVDQGCEENENRSDTCTAPPLGSPAPAGG